jgi:hypothetical protein
LDIDAIGKTVSASGTRPSSLAVPKPAAGLIGGRVLPEERVQFGRDRGADQLVRHATITFGEECAGHQERTHTRERPASLHERKLLASSVRLHKKFVERRPYPAGTPI